MMCCYHPTMTVAIDDDLNFLSIINKLLEIKDCICYSSPKKAVASLLDKKIHNRKLMRLFKGPILSEDNQFAPEDYAILMNTRKLHEEIYFKDRFKDVSVLIIDYYMEEMSGFEVCEALANHPSKKILLTGSVDKERLAIKAFNKGLIHSFINKTDPNLPNQLKQAITVLKENYFSDLTSSLISSLSITNNRLLQNPSYSNFVRNLQHQYHAVEYYLIDTNGSIVFLNAEGISTWFIVKHEEELASYETLAIDLEADETLIKKLAQRKYLPCFFYEEDYHIPITRWDEYLCEAKPLSNMAGYYYAMSERKLKKLSSFKEDIEPYANFLQSLKANHFTIK